MNIYQTEVQIAETGHLEVRNVPFASGEEVTVIVLPAMFAKTSAQTLELIRRSIDLDSFQWKHVSVPQIHDRFEDVAFLFESSALNRGIVRLDFDEAAAVFKAIRLIANPRGVEIGRFKGGSTFLLAVAVGSGGKLVSIDIAPQDDPALSDALARADIAERVELITADANTIIDDTEYDFAFIDGDHSYDAAGRDHNCWGRRVKTGGLIIHHDMGTSRRYSSQLPALAQLRADILGQQQGILELAEEAGSIVIFRRTSLPWIDAKASRQ